jgi:hypothetical protein
MLFLWIVEVTAAADSILGPLMDLLDGKKNCICESGAS